MIFIQYTTEFFSFTKHTTRNTVLIKQATSTDLLMLIFISLAPIVSNGSDRLPKGMVAMKHNIYQWGDS